MWRFGRLAFVHQCQFLVNTTNLRVQKIRQTNCLKENDCNKSITDNLYQEHENITSITRKALVYFEYFFVITFKRNTVSS